MGDVAVVTGGSGGIGRSVAAMLAARGYRVFELSRSGEDSAGVTHISCDVTLPEQVEYAFAKVFSAAGRLDLLVNNAGMGISGAVELTDPADVRRIFEVNFFGCFLCSRAALPYMRKSGGGRIVNLSSVAGIIAIPFQSFYSATKAAINMLTAALANEAKPFGVTVCAVMPGDAATGFTGSRKKTADPDGLYAGAVERAVGAMEKDERGGMPPEEVARVVLRAAMAKKPRLYYIAGGKYKLFGVLIKLLPATASNRLVGRLYG